MYANEETYPMNINQIYYVYKWTRVIKIRQKLPFNRLEIHKWASRGFGMPHPLELKTTYSILREVVCYE